MPTIYYLFIQIRITLIKILLYTFAEVRTQYITQIYIYIL